MEISTSNQKVRMVFSQSTLKSSQPLYCSGCVPHHSECGSLHKS